MPGPEHAFSKEASRQRCPCCQCLTLARRGDFEICPVCCWEDDGQTEVDEAMVQGGPNGVLSMAQAKTNFVTFGACDEQSISRVRKPEDFELP